MEIPWSRLRKGKSGEYVKERERAQRREGVRLEIVWGRRGEMCRGDVGNARRSRESGGVISDLIGVRSGVRSCDRRGTGYMRVYCSPSSLSSGGEVVRGGIFLSSLPI